MKKPAPTDAAKHPLPGPGASLRQAREASNLDRNTIAAQLHVSPSIVDAIEQDDYARLPAPVFARGYLRSYARLLDLAAEPLLADYNRVAHSEPPALMLREKIETQMPGNSWHARWAGSGLIILMGLLFYLWWRNDVALRGDTIAPTSTNDPMRWSEPAADVAPADLPPATATNEMPAEIPAAAPPAPVTAAPGAIPSAGNTLLAQSTPMVRTDALPDDHAILELGFSDTSWVDIRDAKGQRLLYGLIEGGKKHAFSAEAPFKVTLGNAPAVSVHYNGQAFDVAQHSAGNVANFELGR